ncbi:MAG: S8 family serine peptidase, partial [Cyanobacteria bacterium P01_D01_bin.116]
EVNIEAENLINLATYDRVEWIDPGAFPDLPENDNTRPVTNVDDVQDAQVDGLGNLILSGGFPVYDGLSGDGITVGVDDDGIDASHPDLNVVADRPASGSHGTHVAGILAGNGVQSNGTDSLGNFNGGTPFQWRGVAPNTGLIDSGDLINSTNIFNGIQNNSLDVSNHSHALAPDGNYNSLNQTVDQLIRGGATSGGEIVPRRPKVFSAGNGGSSSQYGNQFGFFAITKQVKNAVVVGNWDASDGDGNINNDILRFDSSLGPAHDGRLKPDVVAPGTNIFSTNTSNGYRTTSGTSMASPVVAGIHALLLEGWQNTYSTPLGTTIDDRPPLPSTLRALLIQTAEDIVDNDVRGVTLNEIDSDNNPINGNDGLGRVTATVGPDYATGWGLVDAEAAVELMQDFRQLDGVPIP